jgi:hypothetical protein
MVVEVLSECVHVRRAVAPILVRLFKFAFNLFLDGILVGVQPSERVTHHSWAELGNLTFDIL